MQVALRETAPQLLITSVTITHVVGVDVCISSYLKEELAWAVDKRLQVISNIMLFKNSKTTKELNRTSLFKFETILYMLLCGP